MSNQIVIPVLVSGSAAIDDSGGAASVGRKAREAVQEHIQAISVAEGAIEGVVDSAVAFLLRAAAAAASSPRIQLDALTVNLGMTASGALGLLGTGVQVEAQASFELTFKIVAG